MKLGVAAATGAAAVLPAWDGSPTQGDDGYPRAAGSGNHLLAGSI